MAEWEKNGKIKLMIIVGTRPEIIRLAAVIKKSRRYFDTILVHTGQNYDYNLNGVFFKDLGLDDPELYLDAVGNIVVERHTGGETVLSLFYHRAALVVVTARNAEGGFLSTTRHGEIVVLPETPLRDGIYPVCIVVILLIFGKGGVIV